MSGCKQTSPMKTIDLIAGARPNFMKIAPIIDALKAAVTHGSSLRNRLIHTGRHYDRAMSAGFFEQLGIPEPDINLEVGSGTQAEQSAAIMVRYEKVLLEQRSDLCLVVGDVNSTMACSIVARKLEVPVAHVEGGIRSGDWTMPEEINRVVTDSIRKMGWQGGRQDRGGTGSIRAASSRTRCEWCWTRFAPMVCCRRSKRCSTSWISPCR
jgi:UDP-N-acetylglucosamine 2-epimerase